MMLVVYKLSPIAHTLCIVLPVNFNPSSGQDDAFQTSHSLFLNRRCNLLSGRVENKKATTIFVGTRARSVTLRPF